MARSIGPIRIKNKILKFFYLLIVRLASDEISVQLLGGIWKIKDRANSCKNLTTRKFLIDIYNQFLSKYCCYIAYNSIIDDIPTLPHAFFGIFISHNAKIGKNCVIFPHVIIGSNTLPDSKGKGSPTIGNNVFIGAGASIIGNVKVGDNCRIGSNCVITRDIPDNSLVIMEKPRIIRKYNMNNTFYTQTVDGHWNHIINGKKSVETNEIIIKQLNEIDIKPKVKSNI